MKQNAMIYIFYTFLLITFSADGSFDKKTFKSEYIDAHCHYLNNLILPIETLKQIKLSKKKIQNLIIPLMNAPYFKETLMHASLYEIHKTQSFHYIMRLWNMLNSYCFLHNEQLKKEYCILILIIYKEALTHYYKDKGPLIDTLNSYYNNINDKDLNEILAILNIVAQELRPLLETMNKIKTWKEWISQYWFNIFIVSIVITIKIAIYKKKAHQYQTSV